MKNLSNEMNFDVEEEDKGSRIAQMILDFC